MTSPKIPYKKQPQAEDSNFTIDGETTPLWANILFSGVKNKDKIEETFKKWEKDPSLAEPALKGLLGQYLLNEILPNNMNIDLKDRSMNYSTKNNMDIGSNRGDTNFLNLGWRF